MLEEHLLLLIRVISDHHCYLQKRIVEVITPLLRRIHAKDVALSVCTTMDKRNTNMESSLHMETMSIAMHNRNLRSNLSCR